MSAKNPDFRHVYEIAQVPDPAVILYDNPVDKILIFGATQVIPVITLNVAANIGRTTARAKVSSRINRQARNKYRILK